MTELTAQQPTKEVTASEKDKATQHSHLLQRLLQTKKDIEQNERGRV